MISRSIAMSKKTICLNMIVKNEAHLIAETLAQLLTYITFDYWVISDTGSTDATKEIIVDFFKTRGIPGELVEHAWQDFGHNRSKAFEAAYNKTDYAFVWDADDEISGSFKMPAVLTADSYMFTFGNSDGFRYSRHQLFNNRKRWCYRGVLHEYAACLEPAGPSITVSGDYFFVSGRRGDRSKDPNKYLKDALILEKAAEKALAEKDPLYNRYIFYCAQSYASCNMHEKAIEFYKRALTIEMWVQEKYVSCIEIYEQYERMGKAIEGLPYLIESYKYDKDRIECIYRLIKFYCVNGQVEVSYMYYSLIQDFYENRYEGSKIGEKLFAKKAEYDFYLPYYMIITAEKTRHLETAAKMYEAIVKHEFVVGEWWIRNVVYNIQFCFSALPKSLDFFYNFMDYIKKARASGITFESVHLNVIGKLIDHYRPLLSASDLKLIKPSASKPIKVMMTFTTCKRLDLFQQTVNGILNSWTDLDKVDYFFCVDDNSSQRDRSKMREMYPFIDFHMKRKGEKGHRASMNIIYDKLKELQPTYWIHMEDDWVFFEKANYVQKSIDFLDKYKDKEIHQILYNRNYAETYDGWEINGSEPLEKGFLLHVKSDTIPGRNCAYWPHYSFRPSMIRVSTIMELGNYDSINAFFERDYADKYFAKGYKSAFFDTVSSLHIGKLTSDKTGQNAYTMNGIGQFGDMDKKSPNTFVVNLLRRTDRKEAVEAAFDTAGIKESDYEFIEAVDGRDLVVTDEINTLFAGNDFGSRKGVIGCALSHYGLWKQLAADTSNEYYTIFEDDIALVDGFKNKWAAAKAALATSDADIIFLGYHVRDINNAEKTRASYKTIESLNSNIYVGGTFGYIINKRGCKKLLNYIATNGIKHGIDYLIKIAPNLNRYNCQPHIILSDWVTSSASPVDTDIQKDYSFLQITPKINTDEWIFHEGLDSSDGDIRYVGKLPVYEIMKAASADTRCIAFNTLGFLKMAVTQPLKATPYICGPGSGLYVKKTHLHIECMNTRTEEKESYEEKDLVGLARRCDWFVYHNGYVNISNTNNPKTIYISASYVFLPYNGGDSLQYFMDNLVSKIKSKFNLVIAGNDFTFPKGTGDARRNDYTAKQELIQSLLDNPLFNRGFIENLDTLHSKLRPIPLGLLKNGQYGYHSNLEITNDSINLSRSTKCMCIHRNRDGPQWELRAKVTELCKTAWSSFVTYYEGDTMNDDMMSEKMKQAQFCICARGGGYDPSPKAWTALMNGCIPIIQHSPLDEAYRRFPVVFVDDWTPESLSEEKLNGWLNNLREFYEDPVKRLEVLKMLSLDYWWNLIQLNEPTWISSYLCGGLGNRLFQISAALGLAEITGQKVVFYTPQVNSISHQDINNIYRMFPDIKLVKDVADVDSFYEEKNKHFTFKPFPPTKKNTVIHGYRQSPLYLPSTGVHPVLGSEDLYPKYGLDTDKGRLNSWFIHIRLGDYKANKDVNHITVETYHKHILNNIPDGANVILFSDEPITAENQLKKYFNHEVRVCSETDEVKCLGLMSQCWGGAIVPNSTFSWWGAYLAHQSSCSPYSFKAYFPTKWNTEISESIQNHCIPSWGISVDPIEKEEWTFYECLDSIGADIGRYDQDVTRLKDAASANPNCIAFNTLGFLKSYVKFPLIKSPYIHSPGGLYVKKSYKPTTRVKMLCNWCSSEDLCKEWLKMTKGSYKWNDIEITWSDDADYYVIINRPQPGAKYVPEKTIIFHMEPWCDSPQQNWGVKSWGEWAKPDPSKFLQVRSHDRFLNPASWQINLTYSQLKEMDMIKYKYDDKSKIVSSICSSKYFDPGHKKRIDFLKFVEAKGAVNLNIFGKDNQHAFKSYRGPLAEMDKANGIVPYKYYFMCENNAEYNYITEKLWEPILCEALCFYWGCPNVADHIDPMAYMQLNMDDFEASYNMINAAIETDLWNERLPYIKKAKQRILDKQGFFPMLESVLKPCNISFHILIACGGRVTLKRLLDSLVGQLSKSDAITIVFDGENARYKSGYLDKWSHNFKCNIFTFDQIPNLGAKIGGEPIRNKYQSQLKQKTTYIMHADDDDIYLPAAFDSLRSECKDINTLYIAKFDYNDNSNRIIPQNNTDKIEFCNIGTPCGIIPFEYAHLARWPLKIGGDYEYYDKLQHHVKSIIWLNTIIYRVMSMGYGII